MALADCRSLQQFAVVIPVYECHVDEIRYLRSLLFALLGNVHPEIRQLDVQFASTLTTVLTPQCVLSDDDWKLLDCQLRRFCNLESLRIKFHTFTAGGHYRPDVSAGPPRWAEWVERQLPSLYGASPCRATSTCVNPLQHFAAKTEVSLERRVDVDSVYWAGVR